MADTKSIYERRFEAAVSVIQSLPKNGSFQPSNELMLKFYSYYKQATLGPCNTTRPGFWDPIGKYKWDAWNSLGDMPKEAAMIAYVDEMKQILESMPMTEEVEELLCVIGPFYELVDDKKKSQSPYAISADLGNVLSSPKNCNKMNGKVEGNDSGAESEQGEDDEDETDNDLEADNDVNKVTLGAPNAVDEIEGDAGVFLPHLEGLLGSVDGCEGGSVGTVVNEVVKLTTITQETADVKLEDVKPEPVTFQNIELANVCVQNGFPDPKSTLKPEDGEEEKEIIVDSIQQLAMNGEIDGVEDQCDEHSGTQHLASDSDSEVFCDSMEQLGIDEILGVDCRVHENLNNSQIISTFEQSQFLNNQSSCKTDLECSVKSHRNPGVKMPQDLGKGGVTHGGEDTKSSGSGHQRDKVTSKRPEFHMSSRGRGNRSQQLGEGFRLSQFGNGGDQERKGSEQIEKGNVNEQIAVAVVRLQEDMQNVLERLHILETAAAARAKSENAQPDSAQCRNAKRPVWWPFDVSGRTIAFAILWPFIVQLLVHFYFQRRKRKPK
ncbi:acyl-CoA-binding domain-containing protein 5 isoform X2 [Amblyraja radiata]|uniref:acyl-CoA-binding domain-containing protein 5 isoform X2 n=1 Tax=Amblyraja radiata TaxID=386614 RepID=UPI001402C3D2|nr:acyl-CoA-binding domain-containing protein 5 isoform X2 [Amblyraja radiata]